MADLISYIARANTALATLNTEEICEVYESVGVPKPNKGYPPSWFTALNPRKVGVIFGYLPDPKDRLATFCSFVEGLEQVAELTGTTPVHSTTPAQPIAESTGPTATELLDQLKKLIILAAGKTVETTKQHGKQGLQSTGRRIQGALTSAQERLQQTDQPKIAPPAPPALPVLDPDLQAISDFIEHTGVARPEDLILWNVVTTTDTEEIKSKLVKLQAMGVLAGPDAAGFWEFIRQDPAPPVPTIQNPNRGISQLLSENWWLVSLAILAIVLARRIGLI